MILNSVFSWINTDGTINIATDYYHYFVIGVVDGKYKIVTYQGKSNHGYTIIDKFRLAYLGMDRHSTKTNQGEFYVKK